MTAGGSSPIYRLEGLEAKQMSSGEGRTRPEVLSGEVAAGGAAWQAPKCPGTRVCVWKGQGAVQVSLATLLGPVGRGRAVDEVHRRRTGGRQRNREGDGDRDQFVISKKFKDLSVN